jgi:hypothetical protein
MTIEDIILHIFILPKLFMNIQCNPSKRTYSIVDVLPCIHVYISLRAKSSYFHQKTWVLVCPMQFVTTQNI